MAPKDTPTPIDIKATSNASNDSKKKKPELPEDTLSEEDRDLKERLDTCVGIVVQPSTTVGLQQSALDKIITELRTATASMTSVPKPLKFLRPHYPTLLQYYKEALLLMMIEIKDDDVLSFRAQYADVMAVLAMTMGQHDGTEFFLKFASQTNHSN
jgi:26S proteasome regulatory subunit N1